MKIRLLTILFAFITLSLSAQLNSSSLVFDGVNDLDSIPNSSALLNGATHMSLSLWVKPENTAPAYPDFDAFAGYKNETQSDFYIVQTGASTVEARFRNSIDSAYSMTYNGLQLHVWNHFVLTFDSTQIKLYHNGLLVDSNIAKGHMGDPGINFEIGAVVYTFYTTFFLNGKADEVGLWNIALNPAQIAAIMDCPPLGTETGLVGYWNCNETIGTTTTDLTAGNHPGTLMHGAAYSTTDVPVYNCSTGIVEKNNNVSFSIHPNPFNSKTVISSGEFRNGASLKMFDLLGNDVTPLSFRNGAIVKGNELILERGILKEGIYFIQVSSENHTITKRIVIQD